jgi:hypothetical protein
VTTALPFRRPRTTRSGFGLAIAWVFITALASLFAGLVIGLDSNVLSLLLLGLIGSAGLLTLPVSVVLWVLVVFTLVIAGTVQYFGRINQVQWLPSLLAAVMFLRAVIELVARRTAVKEEASASTWEIPVFVWILIAYLFIAFASNVGKFSSLIQFLAGIKNYIAIWGVLLLIMVARVSPEALARLWKGVIAIALLQLPFVLYQHFFVASRRATMAFAGYHRPAWDSVVGTFGGDPDGGGASGALAFLLVVTLTLILALWRNSLLKLRYALSASLLIIGMILLAEIKVVLGLIPLAVLLLFARDFVRRPSTFFAFCISMIALSATIVLAYQTLYWQKAAGPVLKPSEHVQRALEVNMDPDYLDPRTGEVGRFAMLALWARDSRSGITEKLIGHGFGAARISFVGVGAVAKRYYPFQVGRSTAASMLWEIGLLGLLAFTAVLVTAVTAARRLLRHPDLPVFHRGILEASIVSIVLLYLMVFYNSDVLYLPAIGFLLMLFLGQIAYWQLRLAPIRRPERFSTAQRIHRRSNERFSSSAGSL